MVIGIRQRIVEQADGGSKVIDLSHDDDDDEEDVEHPAAKPGPSKEAIERFTDYSKSS